MATKTYELKPKSKLRLAIQMFTEAGLDPCSDWSKRFKNIKIPPDISDTTHLEIYRKMMSKIGYDLDTCLDEWRKHYKEKVLRERPEILSERQLVALEKINPVVQHKAYGVGLQDYSRAVI